MAGGHRFGRRLTLKGKVALVAGGTRGAGRGIAVELGAAGATVYVTGRTTRNQQSEYARPETIEETAELVSASGGNGIAVKVDHLVTDEGGQLVDRIRAEQGRLDVLVNDLWGGENLKEWNKRMRRSQAIGFGLAGGLVLAAGAALWSAPEWLIDQLARRHPGCLYRVPTEAPLVALTIDDGPDPSSTPLILAELRRQDARATFFLIAERVRGQEQLVRTIVSEGHELGNHFTRDRVSVRLSPSAFEADLLLAHQVLAPYGAVEWARPGSGWYSRAMIDVMRRHGYRCALGSVYPFDATIPSAVFAARYIMWHARPGAVVVLHDGGSRGRRTAKVLSEVLPELRRRGYRVVSLSELVAAG